MCNIVVLVPMRKSSANLCMVSSQNVKSIMDRRQYSVLPAFYLLIAQDIKSKDMYSRCLFFPPWENEIRQNFFRM